MAANLQERVTDALSRIRNNRVGANVVESEMIRDIATTTDGKVRLTLFLSPEDDATVVRDVRQTLQQVDGVTDVRVDGKDASQAGNASTRPNNSGQMASTVEASPGAPPRKTGARALPV